jgi:hypothetical protein
VAARAREASANAALIPTIPPSSLLSPCPRVGATPRTTAMLGAALGLRLRVLRRHRRVPKRGRRRPRAAREDAGREPVLLVSGMGGSVLHARRWSNPKFDLRVWVRILFANPDFKKYLWSRYNADTGGLGVLPSFHVFLEMSGVP